MTIAINSTNFIKSPGNDFFNDYFLRTAPSRPEHHFIFITPLAPERPLDNFQNIVVVVSAPRANNVLIWNIWLNYTLPGIARKHKADILIHTGGSCSLRTRLPQCLFISDLSFLNYPNFFSNKQLHFLKKNMTAFLLKANKIIAGSCFLRNEILRLYPTGEKRINAFQLIAGNQYQPVGWKEKEAAKERYAEGKEYFLFSGEIHPRYNLLNLLKAFSFFKKRQKSNMQLIITTNAVPAGHPFIEDLKTYKYRREVNLLIDLPEKDLVKITAAAYAFIYPVLYEGFALFPLRAMLCEVPVITSNTGALCETAGDAALYADPANFEDIADKMMMLFKDENKRTELINKGKSLTQKIDDDKANELFWESIIPHPLKGS